MASKNATLVSLREDLHARFDGLVAPSVIDNVLDKVVARRNSKISMLSKILINREAHSTLESISGVHDQGLIDLVALSRGLAA